jgi:hypothetical protein
VYIINPYVNNHPLGQDVTANKTLLPRLPAKSPPARARRKRRRRKRRRRRVEEVEGREEGGGGVARSVGVDSSLASTWAPGADGKYHAR